MKTHPPTPKTPIPISHRTISMATDDERQVILKTNTNNTNVSDEKTPNREPATTMGEEGGTRGRKGGGHEGNNRSHPRTVETERKRRIEREKGRATSMRSTEGVTDTVRNRMLGIQPLDKRSKGDQQSGGITRTEPGTKTDQLDRAANAQQRRTPVAIGGRERPMGMATVTWAPNILTTGRLRNEARLTEADMDDANIIGESNASRGEGMESMGAERKNSRKRRPNNDNPVETNTNTTDGVGRRGGTKHLDPRAEMFFLPPFVGPDDGFDPPGWFIREVGRIIGTETRTPGRPPIQFDLTKAALENNADVLKNVGYDLSRLIDENEETTLHYGSEFRTVAELEPLLGGHPHFGKLASVLSHGMPYVFTRELDPLTKSAEMQTLIARGNHKSAQESPEQVGLLLGKDVTHGFAIPIPVEIIPLIPNAAVQPLGLVQQWTTNEDGSRVIKYRITQDLSFSSNKTGPTRSINSRVDMGAYTEMIYGWCFPRILHYIVSMRLHHPTTGILISKYDYSDAYRRIAHSATAAAQTIAINDGKAYLSLRLTFGGSPNPPTWCMFSEIVTDLANELSLCKEWDHVNMRSPAQIQTPEPVRLPKGVPMATGKVMSVMVPATRGGKVDGFIDDLINVFLDTPENCDRQPHVVPLAMHLTSRPHAGDEEEPIPRRPILSLPKLMAEGSPAEVQIVLGWRVDTRRLEVSLPNDKFEAWMGELNSMRQSTRVNRKELEQLLGRLNHAAYVMPIARHFLGRIREAVGPTTGRRLRGSTTELSEAVRSDLKLWEDLLVHASRGLSMNLLVTRQPNMICWSDACPLGIGGYNLRGRAWRIRIPKSSPVQGHSGVNNLLEFMGMVVNVWISCLEPESDQACILAIGDNTSAIGWLHHTAHIEPNGVTQKAHLRVARKLARVLIKYNCCLVSQHVKGELNVVADLLSFEGEERGKRHPLAYDQPPNDVLTERFIRYFPSQVTEHFKISQLPSEISSWVTRVLRTVESSLTDNKRAATRATTDCGGGGKGIVITSGTEETCTSINYPSTREDCSPKRFSASIEPPNGPSPGNLQALVRSRWCQTL